MDRARTDKNRKAVERTEPLEDKVDEAIDESFPASDPPAYTTPQPPEPENVPKKEKRPLRK